MTPAPEADPRPATPHGPVRGGGVTAMQAGLIRCDKCGQVSRPPAPVRGGRVVIACPRCGAALHARKPASLARTWALCIAAAILYIPANVYPVMTITLYGVSTPTTIYDGVKELFQSGSYAIGALVFLASITIPMAKLLGLMYLLVTIQLKIRFGRRRRTVLYRVIDFIGRWSMLDIFLLSMLVALVDLGRLADVTPGYGATAFALVVILTVAAAKSLDPRLIWDETEAPP